MNRRLNRAHKKKKKTWIKLLVIQDFLDSSVLTQLFAEELMEEMYEQRGKVYNTRKANSLEKTGRYLQKI